MGNFRNTKELENVNWTSVEAAVAKFYHKDQQELYSELAFQVASATPNIGHADGGDDDETKGRQYFLAKYKEFQVLICRNELIASYKQSDTRDIDLIILVAGVISERFDPLVAALAAMLVARRGLQVFCDDE